MLFYFCCFTVWWWWWPQWCVEFIFMAFHKQWQSHLLMHLITAVLLFCIIVLFNLFKGPDMLWSFKYVPLGLEVVAIWWDSTAWQPFSNRRIQQWNKYDNCKCSVESYTYPSLACLLNLIPGWPSLASKPRSNRLSSVVLDRSETDWWLLPVFPWVTLSEKSEFS